MRNKLSFVLVSFLVVLLVYGLYLLVVLKGGSQEIKTSEAIKLTGTGLKDTPGGDAIAEKVQKSTVVPFERINLSLITLKSHKTRLLGKNAVKAIDLDLEYVQDGQRQNFTVTMSGPVFYAELVKRGETYNSESEGLVDASTIELNDGDILDLVIAYVDNSVTNSKSNLQRYCDLEKDPVCVHITEGFGNNPFDRAEFIIQAGKKYTTSEVIIWGLKKNIR